MSLLSDRKRFRVAFESKKGELLDEFWDEHGRDPEAEEEADIAQQAGEYAEDVRDAYGDWARERRRDREQD